MNIQRVRYAKFFIDSLANGINPITKEPLNEDDSASNPRISYCFSYVSEILQNVIDNGGADHGSAAPDTGIRRRKYTLTEDQISKFKYSDSPITEKELFNRIIAIGPTEGVGRVPKSNLIKWLRKTGLIENVKLSTGENVPHPTAEGVDIGISVEIRKNRYGVSFATMTYSLKAQRLIMGNIVDILKFKDLEHQDRPQNQGRSWDNEQDARVVEMYKKGESFDVIAVAVGRSVNAVRVRLVKKGFISTEEVRDEGGVQEDSARKSALFMSPPAPIEAPSCGNCRFARSGECFPKASICSDYERAYTIPRDERDGWPEMGDASYLRHTGKHR